MTQEHITEKETPFVFTEQMLGKYRESIPNLKKYSHHKTESKLGCRMQSSVLSSILYNKGKNCHVQSNLDYPDSSGPQ